MKRLRKRDGKDMKKRNLQVLHKSSIENSMDLIHIESQRVGVGAYNGTGAHKNKKYDKKLRRAESKKLCRDSY